MLVAPDDFVLWDFLEARLGRNALHVPDGLTRWLVVMRNEIASSVETESGALQGIRTRLRRRLPDHRDAGMGHHTRRDSRQSDSGVIDWGARENRDAQTDLSARSS